MDYNGPMYIYIKQRLDPIENQRVLTKICCLEYISTDCLLDDIALQLPDIERKRAGLAMPLSHDYRVHGISVAMISYYLQLHTLQ